MKSKLAVSFLMFASQVSFAKGPVMVDLSDERAFGPSLICRDKQSGHILEITGGYNEDSQQHLNFIYRAKNTGWNSLETLLIFDSEYLPSVTIDHGVIAATGKLVGAFNNKRYLPVENWKADVSIKKDWFGGIKAHLTIFNPTGFTSDHFSCKRVGSL